MDISKIICPAEKVYIFEGDFVTLKVIPLKMRYQIDRAKTKGVDYGKIKSMLESEGKTQLTEVDISKIVLEGKMDTIIDDSFDNGVEGKILTLIYGTDPVKHSFKNGETPIVLDRKFWEALGDIDTVTFNKIYFAVEQYQKEMSLGELKETKSLSPSVTSFGKSQRKKTNGL